MSARNTATPALLCTVPFCGFVLAQTLCALAMAGIVMTHALPSTWTWSERWRIDTSRSRFEQDWRQARWIAQQIGQPLRIQPLGSCGRASGWSCGWQTINEQTGQLIHESRLTAGLSVSTKPSDFWRIDAWGEPLSGGASILFQSNLNTTMPPDLLCMNVVGRLRRIQGSTCSD
jgi:Tfp pilus assembly protein FimT